MKLNQMLTDKARQYREKTAVVAGERRLSYAELDEMSNKIANALIKIGLGRGERAAILLSNSAEFAVIFFGIAKAGGIAVPLDVKYKFDELASLFNDSQPTVLIAESLYLEPLVPALSQFKSIEQVIEVGSCFNERFLSYEEIVATSPAEKIEVETNPKEIVYIGYTSGPTSHPKGTMLSQENIIRAATIAGDGFEQTDEDVVMLFALPMHHILGLIIALLASILKGSTTVILTGLSVSTLMETIEKEGGSIFMGVPYVYALLVNAAEQERITHDLSSLRLYISGGASLSDEVAKRFKQHYGLNIVQVWGLTESTANITCSPANGTGKLGSAGKLLPGWEMKVIDGNGKELPQNQEGELIVRGPIMKGYYHNPRATSEIIKDGWLYTGDIGKIDEDGYMFITGRKKRMIIVKGQNIYPVDIEEVLHTHPKIAEAVVAGIPDELRGEVIRVVICLREGETTTEEEIKQFCRQRLANYKVPKQIIFLDSMPKTSDEKIRLSQSTASAPRDTGQD